MKAKKKKINDGEFVGRLILSKERFKRGKSAHLYIAYGIRKMMEASIKAMKATHALNLLLSHVHDNFIPKGFESGCYNGSVNSLSKLSDDEMIIPSDINMRARLPIWPFPHKGIVIL